MATIRPYRSTSRVLLRLALIVLTLIVLVLSETLTDSRRAQAGGQPPAEVVAAISAAYGTGGTVAVVVARQLIADPDLPLRATEDRAARLAARSADNGRIARRPFPSASMVK